MRSLFLLLTLLSQLANAQIRPLAQEHVAIWTSPDPERIYGYTPGICRLASGRLVVTHEISSAGKAVPPENKAFHESRILTSDDSGKTWTHRANFDLSFARPFVAGKSLYILGRSKQVAIIRLATTLMSEPLSPSTLSQTTKTKKEQRRLATESER